MEDNVMYVFLWVVAFTAVVKNHLNVIVVLVQILKEEESTLVYIVINVRTPKCLKPLRTVLDTKSILSKEITQLLLISDLKWSLDGIFTDNLIAFHNF